MAVAVAAVVARDGQSPGTGRLPDLLRAALPALAYGARVSASVCLAYYAAFWLMLDDAYWAGTSAAFAIQPALGASRRKGGFRVLGTCVGAVFAVALTACFPQDRVGFLAGLALWGGACAFVNSLLANFAAYAAALAGYTAAIVAAGVMDSPDQVFITAVNRASCVVVGVVAVEVVVSLTSMGQARNRLAEEIAAIAATAWGHVAAELADGGHGGEAARDERQALLKRAAALGVLVDTALGEEPEVRARRDILDGGTDGLFGALSCWRAVGAHLATLPPPRARDAAHAALPPRLAGVRAGTGPGWLLADPAGIRDQFGAAAAGLEGRTADDPSTRLVLDRTAECLRHLAGALNAVALLTAPRTAAPAPGPRPRRTPPDLLPPLVNAVRVFLVIACAELIWVATAWPSGTAFILFAFIVSILLSSKNEGAYGAAVGFTVGTVLATVLVAVLKFAVLPQVTTFAGAAFWIAAFQLPVAALSQAPLGPKPRGVFGVVSLLVAPLLGLVNEESYDTGAFYNSALATVAGSLLAAASMRLVPPIPAALRAARIVAAAWRDVRRLARPQARHGVQAWNARVAARLAALPEDAAPAQRGQLVRALATGEEIDRLGASVRRFGLQREFEAAVGRLAAGDDAGAAARLSVLDQALASQSVGPVGTQARLRARASVRGLADAFGLR